MPLPQTYAQGVVFVGRVPRGKPARLAATGVLVNVDPWHLYIVTANHVVEGADETFIRVRRKSGYSDLPVPEWVPHGTHDIAVAPILKLPDDCDLIATGITQFIDEPNALEGYGDIELGDQVYFIGLLGKVKAMTERVVPIVRGGFLGALMQEDVPVRRPREKTRLITAHLIDCRSFSGFSGSPCYLQKCKTRMIRDDRGVGLVTECRTLLLGIIGGHFDDWAKARQRPVVPDEALEDEGERDDDAYIVSDDIETQVSTGVGYVIPAEFIRETLMREELVEMRKADEKAEAAERAREERDNAAVEDTMEDSPGEFERFEDLTRKLVNTPKPPKDS